MQPRDRVLAAVNREPLDRMPLRLNARKEVVESLLAHLGLDNNEALLQRLGIDFRYVGPGYTGPEPRPGAYIPPNAPPRPEKTSAVAGKGIANNFSCYHPFANMTSAAELDPFEEHTMQALRYLDPSPIPDRAARINSDAQYLIAYKVGGRMFTSSLEQRGHEQFLMDLALQPDFAERLFEIKTAATVEKIERVLGAAADVIDVVQINDDLGTQQSVMISPQMIRQLWLPRFKRICETVHRHGTLTFFHCCGAIRPIIPDLIEAGVDILNPIQPAAAGMAPEELKRDFGDQISFCGGVDVQSTLPFGSADDVREEVTRLVSVLGEDGGYIVDSSNLIQPDTPPENVLAMFDTARELEPVACQPVR